MAGCWFSRNGHKVLQPKIQQKIHIGRKRKCEYTMIQPDKEEKSINILWGLIIRMSCFLLIEFLMLEMNQQQMTVRLREKGRRGLSAEMKFHVELEACATANMWNFMWKLKHMQLHVKLSGAISFRNSVDKTLSFHPLLETEITVPGCRTLR